jgi:hypothetical protein
MNTLTSQGSRLAFLIGFACTALQAASVTFSPIFISIGPNPNTPSPSYPGYTANAQAGVLAGGINVGGDISANPTAFNLVPTSNRIATVTEASFIGTDFPSWLGVADPAAPFNNETGNALYFSVEIKSTSPALNDISLSNVFLAQKSNDPFQIFDDPNSPGHDFLYSFANHPYSPDAVGIRVNGTTTTAGETSTDGVNAIVLTGVSLNLDETKLGLTGTDAQKEAQALAYFYQALGNFSVFTCFNYGGFNNDYELDGINTRCDSGMGVQGLTGATVGNVMTPEPSYLALFGLALVAAGWTLRPSKLQREASKHSASL